MVKIYNLTERPAWNAYEDALAQKSYAQQELAAMARSLTTDYQDELNKGTIHTVTQALDHAADDQRRAYDTFFDQQRPRDAYTMIDKAVKHAQQAFNTVRDAAEELHPGEVYGRRYHSKLCNDLPTIREGSDRVAECISAGQKAYQKAVDIDNKNIGK